MRLIYVDTDNVTKYVDLYLVVSNVHFNPLHNVRGVIDVCSRNLGSLEADLNELYTIYCRIINYVPIVISL